jgi:hypothetical protein
MVKIVEITPEHRNAVNDLREYLRLVRSTIS